MMASKKHRRWPWALLGLFALLVSLLITSMNGGTYITTNASNIDVRVTDQSNLEKSYMTDVGDITLDLSELNTLSQDTEVELMSEIGSINVTLPKKVTTIVRCDSNVGQVDCRDTTGDRSSPKLTLIVSTDTGQVTVK